MEYVEDGITLGEQTFSATMAGLGETSQATSAPTSSSKGYIGEFRLVKLTNSYKLYLCVDIDDDSYIWKEISLS